MRRPFVIGLTGSIGMGKTTTAEMFAKAGVPTWDADSAVHKLYEKGGAGAEVIAGMRPEAIVDGAVDRGKLKEWIAEDRGALARIEMAVHPLVARDRAEFVSGTDADIVLLDIPLLFETGAEEMVDMVVVVSASPETQAARVMDRPGMSERLFRVIQAKQLPDAEKRKRADRVIETETIESARAAVQSVIAEINERIANA